MRANLKAIPILAAEVVPHCSNPGDASWLSLNTWWGRAMATIGSWVLRRSVQ
jgi:hypothetical protein